MARLQIPRDEGRFGFIPRCTARTRKLRDAFTMSLDKYPMVNMPDTPDAAPST